MKVVLEGNLLYHQRTYTQNYMTLNDGILAFEILPEIGSLVVGQKSSYLGSDIDTDYGPVRITIERLEDDSN